MEYIAVIASSFNQYDQFVGHWVKQEDRIKFKRIRDIQDIRGCRFSEVIRIGTYYELRHHDELYDEILVRIKQEE